MKRSHLVLMCVVSLVVLLMCGGAAAGAKYDCNGTTPRSVVEEDVQVLPDGRTLARNKQIGFTFDKDPNNPVHGAASTCMGSVVSEAEGGNWSGSGICEEIDSDMDVIWSWWEGNQDGGTWGYIRGTGKFEGVTGGGTWKMPTQIFPDGRAVGSFTGTMELR